MSATLRSHIATTLMVTALSAFWLLAPASAQPSDPCAEARPATPTIATPIALAAGAPAVPTDAEAVLFALAIRQEQVVTALEIAQAGEGTLAGPAEEWLDEARDHLDATTDLLPDDASTDPARVVAVVDRLRQERDLPADAAALTVWEPDLALSVICTVNGAERDAATIALVRDASLAIVDLTGLAEPLLPEHLDLLADLLDAAEARLDALTTLSAPPATPRA